MSTVGLGEQLFPLIVVKRLLTVAPRYARRSCRGPRVDRRRKEEKGERGSVLNYTFFRNPAYVFAWRRDSDVFHVRSIGNLIPDRWIVDLIVLVSARSGVKRSNERATRIDDAELRRRGFSSLKPRQDNSAA